MFGGTIRLMRPAFFQAKGAEKMLGRINPAGVNKNFQRKFLLYIAQQGSLLASEGGIIKLA
jgi:hypothetical protein